MTIICSPVHADRIRELAPGHVRVLASPFLPGNELYVVDDSALDEHTLDLLRRWP